MANEVFRRMTVLPGGTDPAGPTVRRLRRKLDSWADSLGFSQSYEKLPAAVRPEVVRCDETGKFLFFGDVMDVNSQQSALKWSVERFVVATGELGVLLRHGDINGGKIAFALNDGQAADEVARLLGEELVRQGLADEAGEQPSFAVKQLAPDAWVAYW